MNEYLVIYSIRRRTNIRPFIQSNDKWINGHIFDQTTNEYSAILYSVNDERIFGHIFGQPISVELFNPLHPTRQINGADWIQFLPAQMLEWGWWHLQRLPQGQVRFVCSSAHHFQLNRTLITHRFPSSSEIIIDQFNDRRKDGHFGFMTMLAVQPEVAFLVLNNSNGSGPVVCFDG